MKKALAVAALAGTILAGGSLALASTTTTTSHGFSFNNVALTQSDWGTVSGFGYTALVECPSGQQYVNAYVRSEDNNGAYNIQDVNTIHSYLHDNGSGDPDGVYLYTGLGQGGQGNGVVELICAG